MDHETRFREATRDDLPTIVDMLRSDPLGKTRELASSDELTAYGAAFEAIDADPHNTLLVATTTGSDPHGVLGVLQLTFIPNLTYCGAWRAQIEGVRISEEHRSRGVGEALIREAIRRASERGCRLVQPTTDKRRPDAIRFYERLGFRGSHEGMKFSLDPES
jgi:ribosomal protein S18 acetylase RimI-like enzyme